MVITVLTIVGAILALAPFFELSFMGAELIETSFFGPIEEFGETVREVIGSPAAKIGLTGGVLILVGAGIFAALKIFKK